MGFIREQIKEKPISKRRLAIKIGGAVICGLIFAAVVCLVLAIALPVIINRGEKEPTELVEQTESETGTEDTSAPENGFVLPPDFNLSMEEYQALQNELYRIGDMANKSMVTVSRTEKEEDWITNDFATEGQGSGLIISEDGNYVYILTGRNIIGDAAHIRVSFTDGTGADATLLKYDGNTGMAVLTVEKRQINANTKRIIRVAKLGSKNPVANGTLVLALGCQLGTNSSILTGNITSVENEVVSLDNNYSVFTTDIVAGDTENGVLINTQGEVLGIVMKSFVTSQDTNTLTAVAYSEVARVIDNLKNRKDIPYVGVFISTVTDDISDAYDIPKGVFIREVAMDSPAMKAGLQSGDVITHVNGDAVLTDALLSEKISQLIPGTTCELSVKRQNGNEYYDVVCTVTIGVLE